MRTDEISNRRERHARALQDALERIVRRLASKPEVRRVIVFGSYAAGRRDLFTDLDLLVVMESKAPFVARTAALYRELQPGVDLDLLVYTPEEFDRLRGRGFVRHAAESGRVLVEKPA